MNRIVCVTGRSTDVDSVGRRVYELLSERELPADVEVVDGGADGLDQVRPTRPSDGVILVDCVSGTGDPGEVVQVSDQDLILEHLHQAGQGLDPDRHSALVALLNDRNWSSIILVGLEQPVDRVGVWRAAEICLVMAEHEALPADKQAAFCWSA